MAKELDNIANVTTVGNLPQKMEEAETAKTEVEGKILERVTTKNTCSKNALTELFLVPEWSFTGNSRRVGTMREEDERRSWLDRKNKNFLGITTKQEKTSSRSTCP